MEYSQGIVRRRRVIPASQSFFSNASAGALGGAGDVVASATAWCGTRAYTTASIGSNAIRLHPIGDASSTTNDTNFVTVAGGGLDIAGGAGITAFIAAHGACSVNTLFDQTGHGNDFIQTSAAAQPLFALTGGGGLTVPTLGFVAASSLTMRISSFSTTIRPTISAVAYHSTSAAAQSLVFNHVDSFGIVYRDTGNNQVGGYAGTNFDATAADGAWASVQAVFTSSTNDILAVNASQTTGTNMGANQMTAGNPLGLGEINGANLLDGFVTEVGLWPSAFTGTQLTNMYLNQKAYYGLP